MRVDRIFQRTSRFATSLALLALLSGCGPTLEITPTQAQAAAGTTLRRYASSRLIKIPGNVRLGLNGTSIGPTVSKPDAR